MPYSEERPIYNGLVLCVPVIVGTIALHEHFPKSPALAVLRVAAFILIACGAIVLSRKMAGEGPAPKKQRQDTTPTTDAVG